MEECIYIIDDVLDQLGKGNCKGVMGGIFHYGQVLGQEGNFDSLDQWSDLPQWKQLKEKSEKMWRGVQERCLCKK
jgi:hypothetical protein